MSRSRQPRVQRKNYRIDVAKLQALWDRIAERPGDIPVPESHVALAEERLAEYRRDPSRARTARDVLDQLEKKER
jgi:hypothetical protein